MQGYSKRWLVVSSAGILSYSKYPGGRYRSSVDLADASIMITPAILGIDVGKLTFFPLAIHLTDKIRATTCITSKLRAPKISNFGQTYSRSIVHPNTLI